MGIAIDVEEFEYEESKTHKKQDNLENSSVNKDLIRLYRKYEVTRNAQNTMDTFIVYAPEFHEELKQSERHLFSTEISFDNQTFFLGDLSVMQDTEGILSNNKISIEKFKQRIQLHSFWNYFEIKALLFKPAERDGWNVQFIYVRLVEEAPNMLDGVRTDHLLMLHQLCDISQLNDLLRQISMGDKIKIGQITASLELVRNKIKYDFYQRSHQFSISFGVDYPCYALSKSGANSNNLKAVQVRLTSELRNLSKPFEDIRDAVARTLGLGFLAGAYSPFVVVLAPMLMDVTHMELNEEKIHVRLDCSPVIKLDGLRMSLYGRDNQDKPTGLHETVTEFSRDGDSTTVYSDYHLREEDKPSVSVKVVIYYREHPMYEKHIIKSS
jgi:hypothetical protein